MVSRIIHLDLTEEELQVIQDLADELTDERHSNAAIFNTVANKIQDAFENG